MRGFEYVRPSVLCDHKQDVWCVRTARGGDSASTSHTCQEGSGVLPRQPRPEGLDGRASPTPYSSDCHAAPAVGPSSIRCRRERVVRHAAVLEEGGAISSCGGRGGGYCCT